MGRVLVVHATDVLARAWLSVSPTVPIGGWLKMTVGISE